MKVIDLLNKIANGEAPKNIKYDNKEYYLYNDKVYITTDKSRFFDRIQFGELDNEVEIIEEDKKIEKMIPLNNVSGASDLVALSTMQWENNLKIERKINEIIDYLK